MQITLDHLHMTYPGGKRALKNISLRLAAPGLVGLLGPNGAGKSTLMKLLVAGLLPTSGTIAVDGTPLQACEAAYQARLGYLPQSFGLFDELTVFQFLDYMAALKGLRKPKVQIDALLCEVNLQEKRNSRIRSLSGGQRQRVGIAQALLGSPELLIFDEPTVGLDPEERIHFRNLFSRLAESRLVLLSTHIIEDVQSVCDSLVVIHSGEIVFQGAPAQLICNAKGHVGVFYAQDAQTEWNGAIAQNAAKAPKLQNAQNAQNSQAADTSGGLHITARQNTAEGIVCRVVAQALPSFATVAEPTLEDAYLYAIETAGEEST